MSRKSSNILWYKEVEEHDLSLIGKHNLKRAQLSQAGFTLPEAFIITSGAYFLFLHHNKVIRRVRQLLETLNYDAQASLAQVSEHIQKLIREAPLPDELIKEIDGAYTQMSGVLTHVPVSMTPSITSEDLATPKQIGQLYHADKITGETNLILEVKQTWASLFAPQALLYRHEHNIDNFRVGLALHVERVITAKLTGELFTFDPLTHDKSIICIETSEAQYHITKKTHEIIHRQKAKYTITETQLRDLATIGEKLEHYAFFPQLATWAIDNGTIYLLATKQAITQNAVSIKPQSSLAEKLRVLGTGTPLFPGIVSGKTVAIMNRTDAAQVNHGDIVMVSTITKDLLPALKKASGFLSQQQATSLERSLARELGIPSISGIDKAPAPQTVITLDATKGIVYKGAPHTNEHHTPTATKLYTAVHDLSLEESEIDHADGIIVSPHTPIDGTPLELATRIAAYAKRLSPQPVLYCFADEKASILGFHGAYQLLQQRTNFLAEVEAIRIAHEQMHCQNVSLLVPYVRTRKELVEVQRLLANNHITRGPHMKIFLQIALPGNVMSLEQFIEAGVDGLVIDVDALTTLILGTDRHDSHIANTFDPTDPAVLWAIQRTITTAHRYRIPVILAGEAVSLYPTIIQKSIEWGVTGIAVAQKQMAEKRNQLVAIERALVTKDD